VEIARPLIVIDATNADPTAVEKTLEVSDRQAEVPPRTLRQQAQVQEDQMVVSLFVVSRPRTP
jgi:hypothetical protein